MAPPEPRNEALAAMGITDPFRVLQERARRHLVGVLKYFVLQTPAEVARVKAISEKKPVSSEV